MKPAIRACVAVALVMVGLAHSQAPDPWVGKRVFTQFGTVLKVDNQAVDDEGRTASLTSSGKDRRTFRVYRVEHVNGEWLWLKGEKSGVSGWVQSKYVIPYEQAIDYFTNQIRANPCSESYSSRGNIWKEKGENDIAIADYNEAIRLDPKNESAYNNRGGAWSNKKDYDRAIADFNEALRLDPKDAFVYYNRGFTWGNKKDYNRAIADYNEAIRLDPKFAMAYNNRGIAWSNKKDYDRAIADFDEAIRLDPKFDWAFNNRAWLWATCPGAKLRDGKKAVESATKACELSEWKERDHLGTLAASYAEAGDFDQAVKWEEAAIKLTTDPDGEAMKGSKERLALYKDKKPYRLP